MEYNCIFLCWLGISLCQDKIDIMHITEATLIKTHLIVASRQEEIGRNKIHFSLSGYGFLAHGHAYNCSHVSLRAKHEDGNT